MQDIYGNPPKAEDVAQWKEGLGMTYPALADVEGEFFDSYGNGQDVFVFYIVDRDGIILWRATREDAETLDLIRAELDELFGGAA